MDVRGKLMRWDTLAVLHLVRTETLQGKGVHRGLERDTHRREDAPALSRTAVTTLPVVKHCLLAC